MSGLLLAYSKNQPAAKILKELLVFDWLCSGHKFLPEHLKTDNFNQEKNRLWQNMPQNFPLHFTYKTRNHFFKRSVFMRFSAETLEAAGFGANQQGVICFLAKKDEGLMGHSKILFIKDNQTAS